MGGRADIAEGMARKTTLPGSQQKLLSRQGSPEIRSGILRMPLCCVQKGRTGTRVAGMAG